MKSLVVVLMAFLGAARTSCAAPLSRAEIIERFRAAPATMCEGLVQVWASCPAAMRREYQLPIAGCAAEVCRMLYVSQNIRPRRFEQPGLVITIGDVVTNDPTVVSRVLTRDDGSKYMRIWMPAPGYADLRTFRLATVRGWSVAVNGTELSEAAAEEALLDADPDTRLAAEIDDLVAWRTQGVYSRDRDDEDYLQLQRKVLKPGSASREEVLTFASRLMLYPSYSDCRFRGLYDKLEFREAVHLAKDDLLVRIAALKKADELLVWGGGRGEGLSAAAESYSEFLRALARGKTEMTELDRMLDEADRKLKEALP